MTKQPTLTQIHTEVMELKDLVIAQGKDLGDLKEWKRGLDIARRAVDEYRRTEKEATSETKKDKIKTLTIQVLFGILGLLTVYTAYKSIKP